MLPERLHGRDIGKLPSQEQKRLTYADLRQMLLDYFRTAEKKSLQVSADGEDTIWGLEPLDKFFGYDPRNPSQNPGPPVIRITDDTAAKFIRERREEGVSNATIRHSLLLLNLMFSRAVKAHKLAQQPKFTLPKPPKARKDFIREPQLNALLGKLPGPVAPPTPPGVLDPLRIAIVGEAGGELTDDPDPLLYLTQQQTAAIAGNRPTVKLRPDLASC